MQKTRTFPNSDKWLITASIHWWHWKLDVKICLQARTGKRNAFNWHTLVHSSERKQECLLKSRLSNQSARDQHQVCAVQPLAQELHSYSSRAQPKSFPALRQNWLYNSAAQQLYSNNYGRRSAKIWGRKGGRKEWRNNWKSFTSAPWDHMLRSWWLFFAGENFD